MMNVKMWKCCQYPIPISNWKLATLALATLATMATFAAPLQWDCNFPEAKAQTFQIYQGETVEFEPTFKINGSLATNISIEAVWIQTNGMGKVWWKLDNATFHPSNDVGAAAYRFFVEAHTPSDSNQSGRGSGVQPPSPCKIYRANGTLRMIPSPGFTPAEIPWPVHRLDFDAVEIANAPWPDEISSATNAVFSAAKSYADSAIAQSGNVTPEMVSNIVVDVAPAPGNYQAVSNAAMSAIQSYHYPNTVDLENLKVRWIQRTSFGNFDIVDKFSLWLQARKEDWKNEVLAQVPDTSLAPATNYTDSVAAGLSSSINQNAADISSLEVNVATAATSATNFTRVAASSSTNYTDSVAAPIWQYVLGDRVWFAVTNYMRTADGVAPSLQLWEVREGVTNLIYHSTEEMTNLIGRATAPLATTQALDAVRAAMPSKAWSRYQSATGADNPAPADVTIISTPVVQLTGGGEWTPHTLSAGGTVWTLESNGFTSIGGGGTNGYFSIRNTVTGEEVFSVEERSILPSVPVNAAFEAKGGGEGFYYTVYADARPTLYTSTNLTSRATAAWDAEGEDPNVVVNSWTNNGDGTWTVDVTLVVPSVQYFAYVGVQESKDTVISNKRAASFDGGVLIDGGKYRLGTTTINGVRVLTAEAIQ